MKDKHPRSTLDEVASFSVLASRAVWPLALRSLQGGSRWTLTSKASISEKEVLVRCSMEPLVQPVMDDPASSSLEPSLLGSEGTLPLLSSRGTVVGGGWSF